MDRPEARPLVLAIDDDEELLALMVRVLSPSYTVRTAADGATGLRAAAARPQPDLILLDVEMRGLSGFDVCKALKADPATAHIPVIFLTGKGGSRDETMGFALGAVDYVTKPINAAALIARVRTHIALANQREALEEQVRRRTAQLEAAHADLIACLGRAMECHESAAVGNRFQRVAQYARLLALAAGAKPSAAELLAKVAPLHDIGKLAVPAEILRKPGRLSAPDWERVRRHPEYGAAIIGEHEEPHLKLARIVALTHHEHWDGSGYPRGLKGEAIPWAGRIVAVADAFEAMTTTQFYREPLAFEQAEAEILRASGTRYDPAIVEAFRKAAPAMRKVRAAIPDALRDIIDLDFRGLARAAPQPAGAPKA
ncbi:MAG: response regulator [Burkholderiales bacterium]|nr:response regulator [Burkholderiales bacterium]